MATEKRLIDANSYKMRLVNWKNDCVWHDDYESASTIDDCMCELDAMPTVDAVEVVHGRIIQTIENGKMKRVFSCCNTDYTQLTMWITPNYCPNCGAKMDGGNNSE